MVYLEETRKRLRGGHGQPPRTGVRPGALPLTWKQRKLGFTPPAHDDVILNRAKDLDRGGDSPYLPRPHRAALKIDGPSFDRLRTSGKYPAHGELVEPCACRTQFHLPVAPRGGMTTQRGIERPLSLQYLPQL